MYRYISFVFENKSFLEGNDGTLKSAGSSKVYNGLFLTFPEVYKHCSQMNYIFSYLM